MSAQNRRYEQERRVIEARTRKAARLVATLLSVHDGIPSEATMTRLDDAGWAALETLAGTRPASVETRAVVLKDLAARRAAAAIADEDPFAGFPGYGA